MGTQVREQIDGLLEHGVERADLIDSQSYLVGGKFHRSAVWPLMLLHLSWIVPIFKVKGFRIFLGVLAIFCSLAITGFAL